MERKITRGPRTRTFYDNKKRRWRRRKKSEEKTRQN